MTIEAKNYIFDRDQY